MTARSNALDFRDRTGALDALDGATFDVLVIGGGVTGAGVARDAAMRGLSTLLVEARDFAAGTSSRSSKMIHGGLRYMAQGDLALVQEAATERKAVERIAPHLTRRTPFVIPAKNAAVVAKLRTGLWAFEKLGGVPKGRRHEVWSAAELLEKEPALDVRGLTGAVVYPEYLTDDARLTLANVRSARAHGAAVISYAPVLSLTLDGGRAVGAALGDALGDAGERARVTAKVIVNAAGPWVDALRTQEDAGAGVRLQLTKGVHVCVDRRRLPIARTIIMPAADRRSVFAVPRGPVVYLGTTDTFYPDADEWPAITGEDVDYLLAAAAQRFTPTLTCGDVVAAWSGVRPLVAQAGKSASDISRKDEVWTGPAGMLSIAGGKLTAYRRMAERVVDLVEETLGRKPTTCATAETPLVGGEVEPEPLIRDLAATLGSAVAAERLVGLYGGEAGAIAGAGADVAAEARHAVLSEGALTLEDYWVRRSARAWFDLDAGLAALEPAAAAMASLLGWSERQAQAQVEACRRIHRGSLAAIQRSPVEA